MPSPDWLHEQNRLIRIYGRDPEIDEVLATAGTKDLPVVFAPRRVNRFDDYAQIDPELRFEAPTSGTQLEAPDRQLGYAAFSPQQRHLFLNWLDDPARAGPVAFQSLYLAMLEVRLFETPRLATAAHDELLRLHMQDPWREHEGLNRSLMLAFWLRQDGELLANWLDQSTLPADLMGIALGWQAMLNSPLTTTQAVALMTSNSVARHAEDEELVAMHLASLPAALGGEPLQYSLGQLDDTQSRPKPWRTSHRDLHLILPQPNIAPVLIPILLDVAGSGAAKRDQSATTPALDHTPAGDRDWTLVLEFGHSRSEYFDFALLLAQRNQQFTQIMDENRNLVYRVIYKKGRLRDFWRLWDYVQGWSTTRVYVNGEEMEKWKIWPYSQYLR